jgi:recombination protein RecT
MTTQTVSQAVATRESGPVAVMWGRRKHFAAVLPASIDVDAFLGTAAGALYADEDLMKAARQHPDSLVVTLMRCAALGHMPGTDEFYLHVRKGRVTGTEGYRGVVERMYRSGAVAKVVVREVCANDPFRYVEGVDDKPVHEIGGRGTSGADFFGKDGSRSRGPMVGVYAYAELTTGATSRVVIMDRDDVLAARESSEAKDSKFSPWNRLDGGKDHPELTGRSMWWKTAAKRLEPWVPTSAEYRREQLRASASAAAAGYPAPPAADAAPDLDIHDAEIVDEPVAARASTGQVNILGRLLAKLSVDEEHRLGTLAQLTGRDLAAAADLTEDEATHIRATLDKLGTDHGALVELLATGTLPGQDQDGGDGDA